MRDYGYMTPGESDQVEYSFGGGYGEIDGTNGFRNASREERTLWNFNIFILRLFLKCHV